VKILTNACTPNFLSLPLPLSKIEEDQKSKPFNHLFMLWQLAESIYKVKNDSSMLLMPEKKLKFSMKTNKDK